MHTDQSLSMRLPCCFQLHGHHFADTTNNHCLCVRAAANCVCIAVSCLSGTALQTPQTGSRWSCRTGRSVPLLWSWMRRHSSFAASFEGRLRRQLGATRVLFGIRPQSMFHVSVSVQECKSATVQQCNATAYHVAVCAQLSAPHLYESHR